MNKQIIKEFQDHPTTHLVAVSKTRSVQQIQQVYNEGIRRFGENRVQELVEKKDQLPDDIAWHLIGSLQKNKVKYIATFVALIHSVDTIGLLKEINKQGKKNERKIDVLLQFHIASESTKHGFDFEEFKHLDINYEALDYVNIKGVMGMATFTSDKDIVAAEFKRLKHIFNFIKENKITEASSFTEISMGMSGDYKLAIQEGSTMVRIGSLLFS